MASKFNLSVLLGSIYEKTPEDDDRLYNTSVLINRQGEVNGVYRKIHMCDAPALGYNESDGIKPGTIPVVVDHEIGKIGLTICYDLRFPELYRNLTARGAEIIFVPAAFFLYTGKHHWLPLLTARAIENQVYIVAPDQWGEHHEGRTSYGSSVIIDPWGSMICSSPERPGLTSAEVDLTYLREVRTNMPILSHGRPELYGG
jgi:predicted amidohydrolase